MVGVRGDLVRVHLCNSMTHDRMANTNTVSDADSVANTDSVADANTMADADSMTDADTMADSDAMSKTSKELRSGRSRGCQGRNDQRSLKILVKI